MITSIEIGEEIPYVQLTIMPDDDEDDGSFFFITFRRYSRRVFVGVEHYGYIPEEESPYVAPCYIIEKTIISQFQPRSAFMKAIRFMMMYDDLNGADYWYEQYAGIEKEVEKWRNTKIPA